MSAACSHDDDEDVMRDVVLAVVVVQGVDLMLLLSIGGGVREHDWWTAGLNK